MKPDQEDLENTNTIPIPLSGNSGILPERKTINFTTF